MTGSWRRAAARRPLASTAVLAALSILVLVFFWTYSGTAGEGYTVVEPPLLPGAKQDQQPAPPPPFSPQGPGPDQDGVPDQGPAADAPNTRYANNYDAVMASAPAPAPSATVALRQGRYAGFVEPAGPRLPKAVEAWLGVPFAQSTAGENRFRPPAPLPASDRAFAATAYGPVCPGAKKTDRPEGEDCLNLNVFRPAGAAAGGRKLPVVVYVHGGAFNMGRGSERDMASFVAWAQAPIVGVSFNYRVGPLGFLPSALTAREGLLNLGLRDQQFLFRWVQENIAAFGGDADNVTLMGLSAGAHSIGHHLTSYRSAAEAPFHRAILESGGPTARATFVPTHPRHLVQFREFLVEAGVEYAAEESVFEKLRRLPLAAVVLAGRRVWSRYQDPVCWPFQPVVDGLYDAAAAAAASPSKDTAARGGTPPPLIPDLPIASLRRGAFLDIPLLTGFNTNEGAVFVPARAQTNDHFLAFFAGMIPTLSAADLEALQALYPDPAGAAPAPAHRAVPPGAGAQWARLEAAYADYAYACPVLQTAGLAAGRGQPVWAYRYAARAGRWATANHADQAPVVAHDADELRGRPGLAAIADAMHAAWVRFAVRGDPNPLPPRGGGAAAAGDEEEEEERLAPGMVPWPRFEPPSRGGAGSVLVFGEGNDERAVAGRPGAEGRAASRGAVARVEGVLDERAARCRFWWDRVDLSQGTGAPREAAAAPARRAGAPKL